MRRDAGFRVKAALAAAFTAALAAFPAPVWAGGELITAAPGANEVLSAAPGSVTLTFGKDLWLDQSHLAVLSQAGENMVGAQPVEKGKRQLWVPVRAGLAGDYTVAYHVSFADGTSVTGAYRFSWGTGAAPAALDARMSEAAQAAVAVHPHTIDGFSAVLLVVDGLVLLGAVLLLVLVPKRKSPSSWREMLDRQT